MSGPAKKPKAPKSVARRRKPAEDDDDLGFYVPGIERGAQALGLGLSTWDIANGVNQPADFAEYVKHNQGWVYAATRAIAQACAAEELRFFIRRGRRRSDWRPLPEDHPLVELWETPNPVDTNVELMQDSVTDLSLNGNAYWLLVRGRKRVRDKKRVPGKVKEIWALQSQHMKVKAHPTERVGGYIYAPPGTKREQHFGRDEIIHFRLPHTTNVHYGLSPVAAAAHTINADEYMTAAQDYTFRNAPNPGAILTNKNPARRLTPKDKAILRHRIQRFIGDTNAGKIMILNGDYAVEKWALKPQEMDFSASGDVTRRKILAMWGVPPAVLGLMEDASRSNVEAVQVGFALWTVLPILRLMSAKITKFIEREFDDGDIVSEFTSPVPPDQERLKATWEAALKSAAATPNEARAEWMGLDPLGPAGDTPLVPAGVMPLMLPDGGLNPMLGGSATTTEAAAKIVEILSVQTGKKAELPAPPRLRQEGDARLEGYNAADLADILVDADREAVLLDAQMRPHVEALLVKGATQEALTLQVSADISMSADPFVEALNARSVSHWKETVIHANRDELQRVLAQGMAEKLSVEQIAARISDEFVRQSDARKINIARTEVVGSMNAGAEALQISAGVPFKEWLATEDSRVRQSHSTVDGQVRAVGKKFRVGNAWLQYPGDPSGPAEEVCQCRCAVAGLYEREARGVEEREALGRLLIGLFDEAERSVLAAVQAYFLEFSRRAVARLEATVLA